MPKIYRIIQIKLNQTVIFPVIFIARAEFVIVNGMTF